MPLQRVAYFLCAWLYWGYEALLRLPRRMAGVAHLYTLYAVQQ